MECKHCKPRYKEDPRSKEETNALLSRLNRIIGQLNGIKSMIEDNRYCGDILVQVSAAQSALKEVGHKILDSHMRTCVSEDIKNNKYESLEESLDLMRKLK